MSDIPKEELLSLQRQLADARESLRLIEEREAEYPLSTDIPLLFVKEKRRLQRRITALERRSAGVASVGTEVERRSEREAADQYGDVGRQAADDRNQEATLQNYLDKMSELLLEKNLSDPSAPSAVRDIARARTVTTLRQLDATRRNLLLGFLRQAGLISKRDPVQILRGAELHKANLSEADLHETNLCKANLSVTDLSEANLIIADLRGANLILADLRGADLRGADLRGADLGVADLSSTFYDGATQWPDDFTPPPDAIKMGSKSEKQS